MTINGKANGLIYAHRFNNKIHHVAVRCLCDFPNSFTRIKSRCPQIRGNGPAVG
jgi:hypothetical protein